MTDRPQQSQSTTETSPSLGSELVVLVTAPDRETARSLAGRLVEERLAACVNVVSGIESIYRWQGEVTSDPEMLLLAKTTRESYPHLAARILELHPYDQPEIIALSISAGDAGYLSWLREACGSPGASGAD